MATCLTGLGGTLRVVLMKLLRPLGRVCVDARRAGTKHCGKTQSKKQTHGFLQSCLPIGTCLPSFIEGFAYGHR